MIIVLQISTSNVQCFKVLYIISTLPTKDSAKYPKILKQNSAIKDTRECTRYTELIHSIVSLSKVVGEIKMSIQNCIQRSTYEMKNTLPTHSSLDEICEIHSQYNYTTIVLSITIIF